MKLHRKAEEEWKKQGETKEKEWRKVLDKREKENGELDKLRMELQTENEKLKEELKVAEGKDGIILIKLYLCLLMLKLCNIDILSGSK